VDESAPISPSAAVRAIGDAGGYGLRFLRKHACRMLAWFVCPLLPLWGFSRSRANLIFSMRRDTASTRYR
jgi:hypothetical protein